MQPSTVDVPPGEDSPCGTSRSQGQAALGDEMRSMIGDLRSEQAALAARVTRLEQRGTMLSRADRDRLERLLPVWAATFGSAPTLAREVRQHDAAGLRLVLGTLSAKQLGRLLRRADRQPIAGVAVERCGVESGAVLWRVVACA